MVIGLKAVIREMLRLSDSPAVAEVWLRWMHPRG
jgi:hypothetical protein